MISEPDDKASRPALPVIGSLVDFFLSFITLSGVFSFMTQLSRNPVV